MSSAAATIGSPLGPSTKRAQGVFACWNAAPGDRLTPPRPPRRSSDSKGSPVVGPPFSIPFTPDMTMDHRMPRKPSVRRRRNRLRRACILVNPDQLLENPDKPPIDGPSPSHRRWTSTFPSNWHLSTHVPRPESLFSRCRRPRPVAHPSFAVGSQSGQVGICHSAAATRIYTHPLMVDQLCPVVGVCVSARF